MARHISEFLSGAIAKAENHRALRKAGTFDLLVTLAAGEWSDGNACPICGGHRSAGHSAACGLDIALTRGGLATPEHRRELLRADQIGRCEDPTMLDDVDEVVPVRVADDAAVKAAIERITRDHRELIKDLAKGS